MGPMLRFDPDTTAASQSRLWTARTALCSAIREEEHAVLTTKLHNPVSDSLLKKKRKGEGGSVLPGASQVILKGHTVRQHGVEVAREDVATGMLLFLGLGLQPILRERADEEACETTSVIGHTSTLEAFSNDKQKQTLLRVRLLQFIPGLGLQSVTWLNCGLVSLTSMGNGRFL